MTTASTGQTVEVGRGVATAPDGTSLPFRIVRPSRSLTDLKWLGREGVRWRDAARYLAAYDDDIATRNRAEFADQTFALNVNSVMTGSGEVLVAEGLTGEERGPIVGTIGYYVNLPLPEEGTISLMAVEPGLIPGATSEARQLRGVGSALVAAAGRDLLTHGVETVYLHPLDDAAATFWRNRGFRDDGGGRLSVRGRSGLEALLGKCTVEREGTGELVICGRPEETRAYRLPSSTSVGRAR